MAKTTGESQTLAFNSGSSGTNFCITGAGIDYTVDGDTFEVSCAGSSAKQHVVGQDRIVATLNILVDSQALDDVFGSSGTFARGATAADWVHNPEGSGSGNPTVTSTKATVLSYTMSVPVDNLISSTVQMGFDALTVGALTA